MHIPVGDDSVTPCLDGTVCACMVTHSHRPRPRLMPSAPAGVLAALRPHEGTPQVTERVRAALERAAHEDVGETLRFPLSMAGFREDHDHAGEACHVLDVVLNLDVLKQAQAFRQGSPN